MSKNADSLRVAALRISTGKSATAGSNCATTTATENATATLKALANKALGRNTHRNKSQQDDKTGATNTHPENTDLLRSVTKVPDGGHNLLRWPRFIDLCVADGVTETEVRAMFTERDIDDLCMEPDSSLVKHANIIVAEIERNRILKPALPPVKVAARQYQERHRCGRCRHFTFNPETGGTGLGWCNVRTDVAMALPSRLIECDQYQKRGSRT